MTNHKKHRAFYYLKLFWQEINLTESIKTFLNLGLLIKFLLKTTDHPAIFIKN